MTKQTIDMKTALIQSAITILLSEGIQGFTLQSVADHAKVSKGGLLHHFPNKQALISGVYQAIIERFEAKINEFIQQDTIDHGRFTRAYLNTVLLDTETGVNSKLSALYIALINDEKLSLAWNQWLTQQQSKHSKTDSAQSLVMIRLAADGLWFNHNLSTRTPFENAALIDQMIQQTYPSLPS